MIAFWAPLYTYHYIVNIISITFLSLAYFMCVLFSLSVFANFQLVTIKCNIIFWWRRKSTYIYWTHRCTWTLSIYLSMCVYISIYFNIEILYYQKFQVPSTLHYGTRGIHCIQMHLSMFTQQTHHEIVHRLGIALSRYAIKITFKIWKNSLERGIWK
jgi:hypothetical protein